MSERCALYQSCFRQYKGIYSLPQPEKEYNESCIEREETWALYEADHHNEDALNKRNFYENGDTSDQATIFQILVSLCGF